MEIQNSKRTGEKKLDARVEVEDSKQQPSLVETGSSANYNTVSTYQEFYDVYKSVNGVIDRG